METHGTASGTDPQGTGSDASAMPGLICPSCSKRHPPRFIYCATDGIRLVMSAASAGTTAEAFEAAGSFGGDLPDQVSGVTACLEAFWKRRQMLNIISLATLAVWGAYLGGMGG
jgi:hypothetical protein